MKGMPDHEENMKTAVEVLSDVQSVLVSTGAGMSSESGVRTFRSENGHWREHRAEDLATPEAIRRDPKLVWEWYRERLITSDEIEPHEGYTALVELQDRLGCLTVVTQNVDGLHQKAGLTDVIELHGNLRTASCIDRCGASPVTLTASVLKELPPVCSCGAVLRPDVVLFGEALPEDALRRSLDLASSCEAMLVVGTSMVVYPAAALPILALDAGARVIEINPEETPLAMLSNVICIRSGAGVALPDLIERLRS